MITKEMVYTRDEKNRTTLMGRVKIVRIDDENANLVQGGQRLKMIGGAWIVQDD